MKQTDRPTDDKQKVYVGKIMLTIHHATAYHITQMNLISGNAKVQQGSTNHGIGEISSHLHFGPAWNNNPGPGLAHGEK